MSCWTFKLFLYCKRCRCVTNFIVGPTSWHALEHAKPPTFDCAICTCHTRAHIMACSLFSVLPSGLASTILGLCNVHDFLMTPLQMKIQLRDYELMVVLCDSRLTPELKCFKQCISILCSHCRHQKRPTYWDVRKWGFPSDARYGELHRCHCILRSRMGPHQHFLHIEYRAGISSCLGVSAHRVGIGLGRK